MPAPPAVLTTTRTQVLLIGVAAAAVAVGGFEAGRKTVNAAAIAERMEKQTQPAADSGSQKEHLPERDHSRINVREIATVPFSQLYDVLRSASREQLLAWARDLEQMPRGPRQRAAVAAYYKSLIQVDHRAAIEAVLHAENLNMRDVAIAALMKAAPESIWGELWEMFDRLPHPNRGSFPQDILWNWSRVDPVAVAAFIDRYPPVDDEDSRLYTLLFNWTKIEPSAAKEWLEKDVAHQKKDAFRAFVVAWAESDRGAAITYTVANAHRPAFEPAVKELAYYLLRIFPDDARTFLQLLPPAQAKAAMQKIGETTTGVILHAPEDYQRPPDVVARWMVSLPVDLWQESVGPVLDMWMRLEASAATIWLNQLGPDNRDAAIVDLCRSSSADLAEHTIPLGFTIRDRNLRNQVVGQFARRLGETREEAIAAVNKLQIDVEQKAYLRTIIPEEPHGE